MKYSIHDLAYSKGASELVRAALLSMEAQLIAAQAKIALLEITIASKRCEQIPIINAPAEDTDPDETNLGQDRREAWESITNDDNFSDCGGRQSPAFSLAYDYFIDGWKMAVAKYAKATPPILAQSGQLSGSDKYLTQDEELEALAMHFEGHLVIEGINAAALVRRLTSSANPKPVADPGSAQQIG